MATGRTTQQLLGDGAVQEALQRARQDLRSGRRDALAWTFLGAAASRAGRHRLALRALRRACGLAPERAAAWYNLGVASEAAGRHRAAAAAYQRALDLDASHGAATARQARLAARPPNPPSGRRLVGLLGRGLRTAINRVIGWLPRPAATRERQAPVGVLRSWHGTVAVVLLIVLALAHSEPPSQARSSLEQAVRPATGGTAVAPPSLPEVRLALVGDLLLTHAERPLAEVRNSLRGADVAFGNLESPISARGSATPLKLVDGLLLRNEYVFRAPRRAADWLADAGFDVVSLANNHTMDYGPVALRDTLRLLAERRIAGPGAAERRPPVWPASVVTARGVKIAFLAYVAADTLPSTTHFAATPKQPGLAFVAGDSAGRPTALTASGLCRDLAAARSQADSVVVSFHWGVETQPSPTRFQVNLAHLAVDAGADVVVGHHPHCLQGIEVYRDRPILYSLGNFVFPNNRDLLCRTVLAELRLQGRRFVDCRLKPVYLVDGIPQWSAGAQARDTLVRLQELCQMQGAWTKVVASPDGPTLMVPAQAGLPPPAGQPGHLVTVRSVVPHCLVQLQYTRPHPRFGAPLYPPDATAWLRQGTARKLAAAQATLSRHWLRLVIWDAYRPLSVQRRMWQRVPDRRFVADPAAGSAHNRGAAVDVSLADTYCQPLAMPTPFDAFGPSAGLGATGLPPAVRQRRDLLQQAMLRAGFRPLASEWWHFEDTSAEHYAVLDVPFDELQRSRTGVARVDHRSPGAPRGSQP
ncbi:MAG: CapA family protein [Fimbriimonadaceae bacterium]|nr:CapA family protein [Fimbriimonadaceae bacterium]